MEESNSNLLNEKNIDIDIQSRLKNWCKKLVDLSSRNPLIKFRENGKNVLKIVDEKPTEIYSLLVEECNQLEFLPKNPNIKEELKVFKSYNKGNLEQKHLDLFLQTTLEEKTLNNKLRNISHFSQSSMEEYGYNSLYLTLGSVLWTEIEYSEQTLESPLLLVPVQLIRDFSKNIYKIIYTNEPCILNPALILKFKNDFNIDMSTLDISSEELTPMEIFEAVEKYISTHSNWILSENIYLSILNFENLVIYKDLESNEKKICSNLLVKTICGKNNLKEGSANEIVPMDKYDESINILDNYQIYSADSSQQQAIEIAKQGHNLIIEGPPGTGKSQTITNIIAELLGQGKKVLFVSQKQAALEVVFNKLKDAGLSDYCLSLHKNADKTETITNLSKSMKKNSSKTFDNEQVFEKIQALKKHLNNYVKELNTPCGKLDKTPFNAIEFVCKNDDIPDIGYIFNNISDWDNIKLDSIKKTLEKYEKSLKYLNCNPKYHSWYGCDIREISYNIKNTFIAEVSNIKSIYDNLKKTCKDLSVELNCTEPKTLKDIDKICKFANVLSKYDVKILEEDIEEKISIFTRYSENFTAKLSFIKYFQNCKSLKKFYIEKNKLNLEQIIKDLSILKELKTNGFNNSEVNYNKLKQLENNLKKNKKDIFLSINNIINLVKLNVEEAFSELIENTDLWKIINKFDCMQNDIDDLTNYFNYLDSIDKLKEKNLDNFCKVCIQNNINCNDIVRTFETQFYRLWLYEVVFPQRAELRNFSREKQSTAIEDFYKLDLSQIEIAKVRLNHYLAIQTNIDNCEDILSKTSEIGILKQEAKKIKKQCSLRKLFKNIPNLLLKLKPCIMMSPVNVSKLLSNTDINFDTVIFDEASQLPIEECIAAIIRAKNIVVAGDSKQLPPTSFFKKTYINNDEDEEICDIDVIKNEDMESLLDQCAIANFPQCPLKWHYRSKHEHLIAFSNVYMYENSLYTFPSNQENDNNEYGVKLVPVVSNKSELVDMRIDEARQIAKAIIEHAKARPNKSLGVVAFNINQVRRIEDMLEEEKNNYPELKFFFEKDKHEPFFIKSIENVQGDERDDIYISMGAFKLPNGKLDMRTFSVLNQDGGEKRLNVLVTRAKELIKVFSAITDADFGNVENYGKGVRLLKYYLDFAERKEDAIKSATIEFSNAETDSPFEDSVLKVLESNGYEVKKQVGCANYRIDLAIVNKEKPGKYILAVECDGASYHSSLTARDRDWLRQKCLQNLGWNIYRIWSTDWFKNRNKEVEKLISAVKKAELNQDCVKKN